MTLAMDLKGVFKCGMSVAPVTDWALYGTLSIGEPIELINVTREACLVYSYLEGNETDLTL